MARKHRSRSPKVTWCARNLARSRSLREAVRKAARKIEWHEKNNRFAITSIKMLYDSTLNIPSVDLQELFSKCKKREAISHRAPTGSAIRNGAKLVVSVTWPRAIARRGEGIEYRVQARIMML